MGELLSHGESNVEYNSGSFNESYSKWSLDLPFSLGGYSLYALSNLQFHLLRGYIHVKYLDIICLIVYWTCSGASASSFLGNDMYSLRKGR